MDKSPDAFRTISEVADALETPAHVLRFWESRFPQIKPVKRAGGRRYYRPADVALLSGIRHLLHDEGMTIRGVQKILREQGVRHVAAIAADGMQVEFDAGADDEILDIVASAADTEPETAEIVAFDPSSRRAAATLDAVAEVVPIRSPEPESEVEGVLFTSLPPLADEVPEAGHIWVEDEPELALTSPVHLHPPTETAEEDAAPAPEAVSDDLQTEGAAIMAEAAPDIEMEDLPVAISGLAARIRALTGPLANYDELAELHSRLGLLHAQMVEAQRLGR